MGDQPPLPSRLTRPPSRPTNLESSTPKPAEPNLTTVSSPSATEPRTDRTTTLSRTPGTPPGETRDTSRSPTTVMEMVSAESRWHQSAQLSELEINQSIALVFELFTFEYSSSLSQVQNC